MKKSVVFSYIKIALLILLIGAGSLGFAKQKAYSTARFITPSDQDVLQETNDLSFVLVEFKSAVTPDLMFNLKKTGKILFFKENTIHLLVGKTKCLSHNFSYCVIPSLGIAEIIFPFHSFL